MEYNLIICGGTFDRLHEGHKSFLRFAFSRGKKVLIGVTSDAYVLFNKKNKGILSYKERLREVENFLREEHVLQRAKIVSIDAKFDQTQVPESEKTALLVSPETQKTGEEINAERAKKNLMPLEIIIAPFVITDSGEKISSSRIREGIIDRNGVLLPSKDFIFHILSIPDSVRELLHKPFGVFYEREIPQEYLQDAKKIVTVGDISTKRLHTEGIKQILSVIDFSVGRQRTNETLSSLGFLGNEHIERAKNPAGTIYPEVWGVLLDIVKDLKKNKKTNTILIINGEEDLVTLPLILTLPLGFYLFYGQPSLRENKKGAVVILPITEELKRKTYTMLQKFVPK